MIVVIAAKGEGMEKPKIRMIVGWRTREHRMQETRMRLRPPPVQALTLAGVPLRKKKPPE